MDGIKKHVIKDSTMMQFKFAIVNIPIDGFTESFVKLQQKSCTRL